MGSTVLDPLPAGSIDRFGLSIATATRDGSSRQGTIYSPADFAAAVPVHFHPLGGSMFLGLFDGLWNAATPSTTASGRYASHTALPSPAGALIDGQSGSITPVTGLPSYQLPITAYDGLKLVSAASSSTQFLTLCTATGGKTVLNFWNTTADRQIQQRGEFVVPDITADGQTVRFDRGVYFDRPWIYLWGRGITDNRVYTARQNISALGGVWLYQSATGWTADPTTATPVPVLSTEGPMSTVLMARTTYVTTVVTAGSNMAAQVWVSKSMADPWVKRAEFTIDTTAAWTGNGAMLQPQLAVNPTAVPSGAAAALPYVKTVHGNVGGEESLGVSWGLFPVPVS